MCVIMYKPVGKTLDSTMIKECFIQNRHGAGYMYVKDGSVYIKKGFMTLKDLYESLKGTIKELGGTTKNVPMVLHFRISTQGGTRPELTHPYPVCRDYNKMRKTEACCEIAMAHNGILSQFSDFSVRDHNDSMEFIHDCAADVINGDVNFHEKKNKIRLLERMSRGSRLIFLDKTGHATMIGPWEAHEGYYFSHHMSFMIKVYTTPNFPVKTEAKKPELTSITDAAKETPKENVVAVPVTHSYGSYGAFAAWNKTKKTPAPVIYDDPDDRDFDKFLDGVDYPGDD